MQAIDVNTAKATNEEDRLRILKYIALSYCSLDEFNEMVKLLFLLVRQRVAAVYCPAWARVLDTHAALPERPARCHHCWSTGSVFSLLATCATCAALAHELTYRCMRRNANLT